VKTPVLIWRRRRTFFITGTDTGVGKTVLTALLAQFLRGRGGRVAALKPVCSGGREDAIALRHALGHTLPLDEINPWHFRAAIAPGLAARLEKQPVKRASVLVRLRAMQKKFDVTLVEGAGGLLSPLGENFDARDLMTALRALPIIVAPNKLGAVNHVRLTLEALPKPLRAKARVVLMCPPEPDPATASNAKLLQAFLPCGKLFKLPWFGRNFSAAEILKKPQAKRTLTGLLRI
jgi:dethiobiotin synthetase